MIQEEEEEDLLRIMLMNKTKERIIVGVDEVGRGSLFGPVFAGAVILNKSAENFLLEAGLKDSKKLSSSKRELLSRLIRKYAISWGLGQASNNTIDRLGIRDATELAMVRALQKIHKPFDVVLVDGILPIKIWKGEQKSIPKGDSLYPSISAASVIAKVNHDSLIRRIAKQFPDYELEKNVGYGTKSHRSGLKKLGATKLHRQSFLSKIISI